MVSNPDNTVGYPQKACIFNGKHNKTHPHQEKNNFQNITNPQVGYVFEVAPKH